MDRTGFKLIDDAFQQDFEKAKKPVVDKWSQFYANKRYVGSEDQQNEARLKDEKEMQLKIKSELTPIQQKLDQLHFPDYGRAETLRRIKDEEEKALLKEKARKTLLDRANKSFKGRSR